MTDEITFDNTIDEVTLARIRKERERVMEHYDSAPGRFLEAWKQGVTKAGPRFFKTKEGYTPATVEAATDKWQLIPNWEYVNENIGVLSTGEKVFLATLCSFYNGDWGHQLIEEHGQGYVSVGDIANRLELDESHIITQLMLNHTGW